MKKSVTAIILFFFSMAAFAQHSGSTQACTYTNKKYGFSFSLPAYLKITPSSDGSYYNGKAATPLAKKKYAAAKGFVFTMKVNELPLDSTLSIYAYDKRPNGDYYFNTPTDDSLKATKISGKGWAGIHEIHLCRGESTVQGNGDVTSELLDGCENIFLSNGKITIQIYTDGYQLDDKLYKQITNSIHF